MLLKITSSNYCLFLRCCLYSNVGFLLPTNLLSDRCLLTWLSEVTGSLSDRITYLFRSSLPQSPRQGSQETTQPIRESRGEETHGGRRKQLERVDTTKVRTVGVCRVESHSPSLEERMSISLCRTRRHPNLGRTRVTTPNVEGPGRGSRRLLQLGWV